MYTMPFLYCCMIFQFQPSIGKWRINILSCYSKCEVIMNCYVNDVQYIWSHGVQYKHSYTESPAFTLSLKSFISHLLTNLHMYNCKIIVTFCWVVYINLQFTVCVWISSIHARAIKYKTQMSFDNYCMRSNFELWHIITRSNKRTEKIRFKMFSGYNYKGQNMFRYVCLRTMFSTKTPEYRLQDLHMPATQVV